MTDDKKQQDMHDAQKRSDMGQMRGPTPNQPKDSSMKPNDMGHLGHKGGKAESEQEDPLKVRNP